MRGQVSGYSRKATPDVQVRLIAVVPVGEAERLDAWGVAARMPSRTATIRHLLKKGLEAVEVPAMGEAVQA